jgi:hypothetical protein
MTDNIKQIKVSKEDIFDYVVGNTHYDPIEKCIDPSQYEVFNTFIYDLSTKMIINQDDTYGTFATQVQDLRRNAPKMDGDEILRICKELKEIAPTQVKL